MKIKRSRQPKKGKIEIIPMIDVMFFLLATFMLASLSMQKINALPINLPQGKAQAQDVSKNITITINKANQIYINQELSSPDFISNKITNLLKSGFSDTIIIAADKDATHGTVMQAMIESRASGAKHFSIITKDQ